VRFHTDAVQALGNLPVAFRALPCDLLSISAHKVGGPKGVGALVVRDRSALEPLVQGGGQQHGLRSGTENIAGAVGFGIAAELATRELQATAARLTTLRAHLRDRLRASVPDLVITADGAAQSPHVLNVCVPGADSEALLMHLDLAGVAASSGSACTSGAVEPSHVLSAMGVPRELALGAVRFSLGRTTTETELDRVADLFPRVVAKVRALAGVLARA
jgi:cysteine desulfurase